MALYGVDRFFIHGKNLLFGETDQKQDNSTAHNGEVELKDLSCVFPSEGHYNNREPNKENCEEN